MPRPKNAIHTGESLKALAKKIVQHARMVKAAAASLEKAGPDRIIQVAFQASVDDGLNAIVLLCGEVDKKIRLRKFEDTAKPIPGARYKRKKAV